MSIPFLRLPLLAQLEILDYFRFIELLSFSMLSSRTKAITKEVKFEVENVEWNLYDNTVDLSDSMMILRTWSGPFWFRFPAPCEYYIREYEALEAEGRIEQLKLQDQPLSVYREEFQWVVGTPSHDLFETMDRFTEHIFNVFRISRSRLSFRLKTPLQNLFLWKYTRQFEYLFLEPQSQIEYALEKLKIDELEIEENSENSWDPEVRIARDSLLNMQCKQVRISGVYKDLNAIIKYWKQGGLPNLESFVAGIDEEHREDLLEGVETFAWDLKNRPRYWRCFDASNCVDIRGDDGTLASIDIVHSRFKFYVWHPKFLSSS